MPSQALDNLRYPGVVGIPEHKVASFNEIYSLVCIDYEVFTMSRYATAYQRNGYYCPAMGLANQLYAIKLAHTSSEGRNISIEIMCNAFYWDCHK